MDRQKGASDEAQGAIRYMAVIGRGEFPEEKLLRYINAYVTVIIKHELPMLIGIQKEISSIELDNEIEKIADAYIGSILVEKELFNEQERDLVSERVINALPLNLDRFNDIGKSILKQLTDEMKTTFSTYQEQKTQGLKRQKKHTQESLSSILHKFNV